MIVALCKCKNCRKSQYRVFPFNYGLYDGICHKPVLDLTFADMPNILGDKYGTMLELHNCESNGNHEWGTMEIINYTEVLDLNTVTINADDTVEFLD